jgi:drug/metabolite transporter (DMT)-like permease
VPDVNSRAKVPLLLVLNGLVMAAHILLAKQASMVGVRPLVYAFASAAGASVFLALYRAASGRGRRLDRTVAAYGGVAGFVSIALPQALIYSASAYVSAGIASLAYAFPTPLTYLFAALLGIEKASLGRTLGIGIALVGAVGLALSRSSTVSGEALWVALAMLAPIAIAAGNIFRTRYWPHGAEPLDLALAMTAAAAAWLAMASAVLALSGREIAVADPVGYLYLASAAMITAFGNVIYFELQRSGGIVSFSQIGYIGAVFGLIGGAVILSERYAASTWFAALVIALGVGVSEVLKRRPSGS